MKRFIPRKKQYIRKIPTPPKYYAFQTNTRIGEIELQIHGLEKEFQALKSEKQSLIDGYTNLRQQEMELGAGLKEKYGEGTYDINTNQFTPTK